MEKKIGKLVKVDLRDIWEKEDKGFTPWLAKETNIAILSEVIGMDLEVQGQEKNVGPFRADILCKDTNTDHYVLIENQLEKTDHSHLGQIITYAAGLEAVKIIWIAKNFTEEHRAAIDWLNRITEENISFFGIEIELYKIGESLPAPMFQVVAKPNNWSKQVKSTTSQITGKTQQTQLEYWASLKKYLEASGSNLKIPTPQANYWTRFGLGKNNFSLFAIMSIRDKFIRVELQIEGSNAKDIYLHLKDNYELSAATQIDPNLVWDDCPNASYAKVLLIKKTDTHDQKDWNNQHEWLKEHLEKFDKYFRPKIKAI